MCRIATESDIPQLLAYAREFYKQTPYSFVPFNESAALNLINMSLADGGLFINDHGFIAGKLVPFILNPDILTAVDLAWYCPKGNGLELKKAFEDWAKDSGALVTQISTFNNDYAHKLHKILTDDGYRPLEVAYIKGTLD